MAEILTFREEEQDCSEVVELALVDMEESRGRIAFEDVCGKWDAEKSGRESDKVK